MLLTRYLRNYSISLVIISVTELEFNTLFFMKCSNFATDSRCLAGTGNLFQNNKEP